jgi:hypothetical protein
MENRNNFCALCGAIGTVERRREPEYEVTWGHGERALKCKPKNVEFFYCAACGQTFFSRIQSIVLDLKVKVKRLRYLLEEMRDKASPCGIEGEDIKLPSSLYEELVKLLEEVDV